MSTPRTNAHITFKAPPLHFDPRRVWVALRENKSKRLSAGTAESIEEKYGNLAVSLGLRHLLMVTAVRELNAALADLVALAGDPSKLAKPRGADYHVAAGPEIDVARNRVLLFTDSVLFEFRSYLDLLAEFVYGVWDGIGKAPASAQTLPCGTKLKLREGKNLRTNDFLLYLPERLKLRSDPYRILNASRNRVTDNATPYCQLEVSETNPPRAEVVILLKRRGGAKAAKPDDTLRLSELQGVVDCVRILVTRAEDHLIEEIKAP